MIIMHLIVDGITKGDGLSQGKCANYNCLSNGFCNVCGLISGYAEGCDITSATPVCDADSSSAGTQDAAKGKVSQCVACTKSGRQANLSHTSIYNNDSNIYETVLFNVISIINIIDGITEGDGSEIGKCPSSYSSYRCLSTGECNVCGLVSGVAEGCDIHSSTPVCDADSTTVGIQDSATGKVSQCVACTKSGGLETYSLICFYDSNLAGMYIL